MLSLQVVKLRLRDMEVCPRPPTQLRPECHSLNEPERKPGSASPFHLDRMEPIKLPKDVFVFRTWTLGTCQSFPRAGYDLPLPPLPPSVLFTPQGCESITSSMQLSLIHSHDRSAPSLKLPWQ